MPFKSFAARVALVAVLCLVNVAPASARFWQCVPYARQISGVAIYGNALTWWKQAEGKYQRGKVPAVGAVMSFRPTARMPLGHVATVAKIVNDREVLLDHANWSYRGGIEHGVRAVDVSAAGDWSQVKVWYAPIGGLGGSVYPLNGFIYPENGPAAAPGVEEPKLELVNFAPKAVPEGALTALKTLR